MLFCKYVTVFFLFTEISMCGVDKKLSFIDAHFDDFARRIINQEEERSQFKVYYANLAQKINEAKEKDPKKERATYRYLYHVALEKMKVKHAEWYEEISPFVCDVRYTLDDQFEEIRKVIKFFLTRYGAYEEFLNFKVKREQQELAAVVAHNDSGNFWDSLSSFFSTTASKVAGFFGFGKSEQASA